MLLSSQSARKNVIRQAPKLESTQPGSKRSCGKSNFRYPNFYDKPSSSSIGSELVVCERNLALYRVYSTNTTMNSDKDDNLIDVNHG